MKKKVVIGKKSGTKKSKRKRRLSKALIITGLVSSLLLFFLLISIPSFIIYNYRESQIQRVDDFNEEIVEVNVISATDLGFVSIGEERQHEVTIEIKNNSEFHYRTEFYSEIPEQEVVTGAAVEINLAPYETKELTLDMPLSLTEQEMEVELIISLSTNQRTENIIERRLLTNEYSFPLNLRKLAESELLQLKLTETPTAVTYSNASKPTIRANARIENLSSETFLGFYEFDLINAENDELVQPLDIDTLSITSESTKDIALEFKFELPPANLLRVGEGNYRIKVSYRADSGGRQIVITATSEDSFAIKVESL